MITIYNAAEQLEHLKDVLNTTTIKTALEIPLTEFDDEGNDLGTPNTNAVCMQSPFFLMTNYLPQIVINLQTQQSVDEQYSTAEMHTGIYVYYAMEFTPFTETHQIIAQRLQYIAEKLLEVRTGEEPYWFDMTLPTLEVNNEVNRVYEESQIPIHVGRISFTLKWKGTYR